MKDVGTWADILAEKPVTLGNETQTLLWSCSVYHESDNISLGQHGICSPRNKFESSSRTLTVNLSRPINVSQVNLIYTGYYYAAMRILYVFDSNVCHKYTVSCEKISNFYQSGGITATTVSLYLNMLYLLSTSTCLLVYKI